MTTTRRATPLHAIVLASMLVTAGGVTHLNRNLPYAESLATGVYLIIPAEQEQGAPAPPDSKRETTAQKRARYAPYVQAASLASNVPAALIEAVITAESAFNPLAVSRAGAVGLMQLMPATAERFGVKDRTDPAQNILGGAMYLNFLLKKFGDKQLAIAAYNAGEGNVKKHGYKIPPFKETRNYVPKVLAYYDQYRTA